MKRDLAVECGFRLEDSQKDFGKPTQPVGAAVRPASVQVGGQRVNMKSGSIGDRHRPRYRPLLCLTAFRTPFLAKCQVLRGHPSPWNTRASHADVSLAQEVKADVVPAGAQIILLETGHQRALHECPFYSFRAPL